MKKGRLSLTLCMIVVVMAIGALFFGSVIFGGRVYYAGDIARIYLPQRAALGRALVKGGIPWWSASVGSGYPLLAEGEVGALYPPNWILYRLLSPEAGLTASIISHYFLCALGFYAYGRSLRLSRAAACFGSMVFALGGFSIAHLSHISILSVAAWLPWMFALTHHLLRSDLPKARRWATSLALALVVGIQFLAGHAQMSLLGMLLLAAYAVFILRHDSRATWTRLGIWVGATVLGVLLAAPQLLPGLELGTLSQRGGGLDSAFFTSYSFHPLLVATYFSPFLLGNPYPAGTVEIMGYVGLLPLAFVIVALRRGAHREKWFYGAIILIGMLLAFGRWNPLYRYLQHVPLLNLFRVPSRYLYWASFGLAVLSAMGLDALHRRGQERTTRMGWLFLGGIVAALAVGIAFVQACRSVDELVRVWRWLPLLFASATIALMLVLRKARATIWAVVACMILCFDLYAYSAVLNGTYNASVPYAEAIQRPRALTFFEQDEGLYRLYTKEEILPILPVMRESLYPNMATTYGLSGANVYMPLIPEAYKDYIASLTAERLNRLNVKYYLIPQLLPVDAERELYDVRDPYASLPAFTWIETPPTRIARLDIESYLSHSVKLCDGELAGELTLRGSSGREVVVPLCVGLDTAEWAYERDDVRRNISHSMPEVATTFPASSGFPPGEHPGHTYVARVGLDAPLELRAVMFRPAMPEAFVRIERVCLYGVSGEEQLLAHLIRLGDHSLVYRSEDVVIYRNEDALPRAYALPASIVTVAGETLHLPEKSFADATVPVQVRRYEDMAVALSVSVEEPSYLILADLAYPGWTAEVDGLDVPILSADGVFRAVALAPGEHEVLFTYKPTFALW
jgi:hypothetical protein